MSTNETGVPPRQGAGQWEDGDASSPDSADKLLSKADALLGRYRPAMAPVAHLQAAAPESLDFPVLTEIVELPPAAAEPVADFPALIPAETALPASTSDQQAGSAPTGAGAEAEAIAIDASRLREEILATLAPELEQRLSDTLKPRANELLDWAMQTVQLELGLSIRAAVRSAVAAAVDEALERQRAGGSHDKR